MTRETALASRPASDHRENFPHGEEFTSIEEELVPQASQMHPLYHKDNAQNGRGALASIIQQFAGANKWQAELSLRDKGAFIVMKEAAENVPFQLPNKFTSVGFLLADTTSSDAGLQAAMANIKSDADPTSETSKRHHFELAATYLQHFYPVFKKFPSGTKCDAIEISDVSGS
eukprot:15359806-Ditylum_brightwellii.AAC.1